MIVPNLTVGDIKNFIEESHAKDEDMILIHDIHNNWDNYVADICFDQLDYVLVLYMGKTYPYESDY